MIMMLEMTGPKPTIRYAMPTTIPARGYASDAQPDLAHGQVSEDPASDEWGTDSLGKHTTVTTTKSSIYSYVNGNRSAEPDRESLISL